MTEVLNWIKAHWLIVLFSAIILVSLPAFWFVSSSMNERVQSEIESRVSDFQRSIQRVENVNVRIKPLTPGVSEFDQNMVINEDVLKEYRAIRESIKDDADAIIQEAIAINRAGHERELVPGLLPAPPPGMENELPYRIHDAYIEAHRGLLDRLNAGQPIPSDNLVEVLRDFRETFLRVQLHREPGDPLTEEEQQELRESMTARRLLEYRQHAEEISVYADLEVFNLTPWDSTNAPSPGQWFDWQHQYWVNIDLVRAINRANSVASEGGGALAGIAGRPSSVIKRILNVEVLPMYDVRRPARSEEEEDEDQGWGEGFGFEGGEQMGFEGGPALGKGGGGERMGRSSSAAEPKEIDNSDPNEPFESDFSDSISGRTSNGLYDIRDVNLSLIVDSNRIPALINAIQSTNLMTVVGSSMKTAPVLEHMAQGYYYGREPVVQLDLEIETIWLRDWTTELMPEDVKAALGIETDDETDGEDEDDDG